MRPQIYLTSKPVLLTALWCHVLCCLGVCPSTATRPLQLRSQTGPSCLAHRSPQSIENFPNTHTEHTAHAPCTFTNRHTPCTYLSQTHSHAGRYTHIHRHVDTQMPPSRMCHTHTHTRTQTQPLELTLHDRGVIGRVSVGDWYLLVGGWAPAGRDGGVSI